MKKIALLLVFCAVALVGSAQVNVANATPVPIFVGVQYASSPGSCVPAASTSGDWILPGDHLWFIPPPGMVVLRVGSMSGTYGTGYEYTPCGPCGPGTPGMYMFNWSTDCFHLKISI